MILTLSYPLLLSLLQVPYFASVWFFANCAFAAFHLIGVLVALARYYRQSRSGSAGVSG